MGSPSPSEAHSAPQQDLLTTKRRKRRLKRRHEPRPLHTQRLAGWLASTATGLGARTGHHVVGQLCDALHNSRLDLPAWTGPQLVQALNEDMKRRGCTWPDQITSPGPFLAQRLRHLPARPAVSASSGGPPPAPSVAVPADQAGAVDGPGSASSAVRTEAQRRIREVLSRNARSSARI